MIIKCRKFSDVSIIGGGIIGISIANELSKKGYQVTVFDKNSLSNRPTNYSLGICRSNYTEFESMKFAHEGYQYWKDWKEYIGVVDPNGYPELIECGAIILKNSNSKDFITNIETLNIPYTHLDQQETDKIVNELGSYKPYDRESGGEGEKEREGSIYFPEAGYIRDPHLAIQNLSLAAKENGTQFEFGKEIIEITQNNERVTGLVLDSGELIESPIIINAVCNNSNLINNMAFPNKKDSVSNDMTVTIKPLRQEVTCVSLPKEIDYDKHGVITIDLDLGIYSRPSIGNKILISKSETGSGTNVFVDQLNSYRTGLSLPSGVDISNIEVKELVSTYDVTKDRIPIYDKSSLNGYYMAIGTKVNQFQNAGAVGTLMSKLINTNENTDLDLDSPKYRIKHYLDYTNTILSVSCFSRKREIWSRENNY